LEFIYPPLFEATAKGLLDEDTRGRVYLLLAYAKNRKVDVTPAEKRALYTMSRELEQEA
jgi:hypothetical protein